MRSTICTKKYIVHNDIADRNILYKYESTRPVGAFHVSHVQYMTFKLSDFGQSKEFNETNFHRKSWSFDVLKLGLTFAECYLNSQPPGFNHQFAALLEEALLHKTGAYSWVDDDINRLITSLVQRYPKDRITIEELVLRLQSIPNKPHQVFESSIFCSIA